MDGTRLIKRIVALGGDLVALENGLLSIDGEALGSAAVEHFGDREATRVYYRRGEGLVWRRL